MQNKKKKFIIYGYKNGKFDTFMSVFYGFYKAAKYLVDTQPEILPFSEVYWFDKFDAPGSDIFNYNDSIFLTEGNGDTNIPINDSSIYYIHWYINKEKYDGKVKRIIDLRYNCTQIVAPNYTYKFDKWNSEKLGPLCYYEKDKDILYMSWATDLLPNEIDINNIDVNRKRNNNSYYIGTLYSDHTSNREELKRWAQACNESNISFNYINPWVTPLSYDHVRNLIYNSYLAVDVRSQENIRKAYIPCRIFKNISYGQIGLTNSYPVHVALEECTLYHPDPYELFFYGLEYKNDYKRIKDQMSIVKEKHTYINRLLDMLKVL